MFKRILYDEWTQVVPQISFWFTFGVFLAISLRAYLLRSKTVDYLKQLPLQGETQYKPVDEEKS